LGRLSPQCYRQTRSQDKPGQNRRIGGRTCINDRGAIQNVHNGCNSRRRRGMTKDERFVILASSLGTVFEWYDLYLYGSLARSSARVLLGPIRRRRATFSRCSPRRGFLVRPFGAIVFGRVGDIVGRKYTFLVTILIMGLSTLHRRPVAERGDDRLRRAGDPDRVALAQALALGGAIWRSRDLRGEHARTASAAIHLVHSRPTATLGLFLSLLVILFTRTAIAKLSSPHGAGAFPFLSRWRFWRFRSGSGCASRVADLPEDEG